MTSSLAILERFTLYMNSGLNSHRVAGSGYRRLRARLDTSTKLGLISQRLYSVVIASTTIVQQFELKGKLEVPRPREDQL